MTKEEIAEIKRQLYTFGDTFSTLCEKVRRLEELQESYEKSMDKNIEYVSVNLPHKSSTDVFTEYKDGQEIFLIRGAINGEQAAMFFINDHAELLKRMIEEQYKSILEKELRVVEESYSEVKAGMEILLKNNLFD